MNRYDVHVLSGSDLSLLLEAEIEAEDEFEADAKAAIIGHEAALELMQMLQAVSFETRHGTFHFHGFDRKPDVDDIQIDALPKTEPILKAVS